MKKPDYSPAIWNFADGDFIFWTVVINRTGRKFVVRLSLGKSIIFAVKEKGIKEAHLLRPSKQNEINRWRHKYPAKYVIKAPYKLNRARCLICQDIIESFHTHDFKWCRCGKLAVDGGYAYFKRIGYPHNREELP